uniref:Uncharacterized protein n=1 Tax=Tetranychus urticae TaxID=32264 RepID=T1KPR1_TETUR
MMKVCKKVKKSKGECKLPLGLLGQDKINFGVTIAGVKVDFERLQSSG